MSSKAWPRDVEVDGMFDASLSDSAFANANLVYVSVLARDVFCSNWPRTVWRPLPHTRVAIPGREPTQSQRALPLLRTEPSASNHMTGTVAWADLRCCHNRAS